jgi:hypothetical protein
MLKHESEHIGLHRNTLISMNNGGKSNGRTSAPKKMKASQVRLLPKVERTKYMLEHATQAAIEYRERPELLIDGGSELSNY